MTQGCNMTLKDNIAIDIFTLSCYNDKNRVREEYYELLTSGLTLVDDIQILNYTHIIPFKAKAWLDLKTRKEKGEPVDSSNIKKHKHDVFRLSQLIVETDRVLLSEAIKSDMTLFINEMKTEKIVLRDIGVSGTKSDILELLGQVYLITDTEMAMV